MEVLETVGAVNVAAAAGSGGLAKVSMEQILSWNPGVILTLDQDVTNLILTNLLWQNTQAAKDRRVYQAPALPWGWFDLPPGVNRLIGIRWLLSTLYSAQPGADLKAEAREFYRLFYHIDLSEEDLMTLLKGAISPAH
jgi:iron complex transport system substrate-binding protein